MTTHIILFDGTRNDQEDEYPTNIRLMEGAFNAAGQSVSYYGGPGNEPDNIWLMEKIGAAFGLGMWSIRDAAFTDLMEKHRAGDKIAVFGFSRGAAIARMFAKKLEGLADVDFLGCFDTVFARLPILGWQQETLFSDLTVASNVKMAAHAVALDEDREAFTPNLMNRRAHIEEVWFPGGHCDIGGGNPDRGLSDGALLWMLEKTDGLKYHIALKPDALAPMTVSDSMLRHEPRRVGVQINDEWVDEPVQYHPSFLERMEFDPVYRQKWKR